MGLNQGIKRLTDGYSRTLTKSELARGYVFVSIDQKILKLNDLEVFINQERSDRKSVDKSGRIGIGKLVTQKIGNKTIHFKLENKALESVKSFVEIVFGHLGSAPRIPQ